MASSDELRTDGDNGVRARASLPGGGRSCCQDSRPARTASQASGAMPSPWRCFLPHFRDLACRNGAVTSACVRPQYPLSRVGHVKRLLIGAVSALSLAAFSLPPTAALAMTPSASSSEYGSTQPVCIQQNCASTELNQYVGGYTGHDEPSLLFYSNTPGSGNNQAYS